MNRGSHRELGECRGPVRGFNEAPIHESGKYQRPRPRQSGSDPLQ